MRTRKCITLIVLLGLFLFPFMEMRNIHSVVAEEFDPPTLTSEGEEGPGEDGGNLILEVPPVTANSHDTVDTLIEGGVLTGQTPEGVIPPGAVEVPLPASQPEEGANTNTGNQSRLEGSYIVHQEITATAGPDILLVSADFDTDGDSPIQAILQAYGDLGNVDLFDARYAIPTLSLLKEYDVVLTWCNYAYIDPVAVGDVLAEYVDMGGKVINLTWSMGMAGNELAGRFITQNYTAMKGTNYTSLTECLGSYNTSSPIMFGITSVCGDYRYLGTYLTPDSSMVAEWRDGELFVATKDDRSVVSINGYVGKISIWSGRMPDVVHSAIWWLHDQTSRGSFGWDNGPLVNAPGGGYGGDDASVLQAGLGMSTFGFGHQFSLGYRVADEFEVTDPAGWQVDLLTFFAYQTSSTLTSTITGVYYQIWDGPPDKPASSVVFGDLTTNRLIDTYWANMYRVVDCDMLNTSRPIMANVAYAGVTLPPGTYWLDWMTDETLVSGPWVPPISINGQTTTGNALQYTGSWAPALDFLLGTQQGFPFIVQGYVRYSLWNQSLSQINQTTVIDQEFPDLPTMSSYLADDFYVHTQWKVNYIFVPGNGFHGFSTLFNASALTFLIYEDNGGKPAGDPEGGGAPPIWALTLPPTDPHIVILPGSGGMPSNTLLKLPDPVTLPQGRYWMIYYPTMLRTPYGQFGRQSADTPYGIAGQLINPAGGWGWGTSWFDWRNVTGYTQPDIAFRLGGTDIFVYLPLIQK